MELVVVDIGGTHARFAIAVVGESILLEDPVVFRTIDYACFEEAWAEFARRIPRALPKSASIAAAGPLRDGAIKLTNAPWTLHIDELRTSLNLHSVAALNDFAAVAHAVAAVSECDLVHIAGPDQPLPEQGVITVLGPGTGLGVAHISRSDGATCVHATEGGHVGFAPQDELDDRILAALRQRYHRVVTEHVHAGPGIASIYCALGGQALDPRVIWDAGFARSDDLAVRAIERFCTSLGATAGDYALAHGAAGLVVAGGLGLRLRKWFAKSSFAERFCAKPRYEAMMASMPVKLLVHPQPGLLGAAAAYQAGDQ